MNEEKKISIPLLIGGLVLVIVVGIGGVSLYVTSQNNNSSDPSETCAINKLSSNPTTPVSQNEGKIYRNGTYTAKGSYDSPAGIEQIEVTITVADDKVSSVVATPKAQNPTSCYYQNRFMNGVSGRVVGKKIDSARISITDGNISGSSLTLNGFNRALEQIKTQAKV